MQLILATYLINFDPCPLGIIVRSSICTIDNFDSPFSTAFSTALENDIMQLAEENKKPSPFVRSSSQFSTILEEQEELEAMSNAGSRKGSNRAEDCCTPTSGNQLRPLARAIQVPNRIRRLRYKPITNPQSSKSSNGVSTVQNQKPKNLWFTGSYNKSFNSKCSKRFETKDLEEDAVHYYYYRSLPRISQQDNYLPSITSSIENIPETPRLPKVTRRADDLLL